MNVRAAAMVLLVGALIFGAGSGALHTGGDQGHATALAEVQAGDYVYVVWRDNSSGNQEVFFRRSTDGGVTFEEPLNLSNSSGASLRPRIVASGPNVYVVWHDNSTGNQEVFLQRSTDWGATFEGPRNLSNSTSASHSPFLSTAGDRVYVAWTEAKEILLRASPDGGATFGPVANVSASPGKSDGARLAAVTDFVHVAWQDDTPGNFDTFFRMSGDGGATFGPVQNLSNNALGSTTPRLAASGSNVYVLWRDSTVGRGDMLFRASADNGASFGPLLNLSNTPTNSDLRDVMAEGSSAYVVWREKKDEVFMSRSTDGGISFEPGRNLSKTPGFDSTEIHMAAEGDTVFIVWEDASAGSREIFFRRSGDGGATFESTKNLSQSPAESHIPQITTTPTGVYVVWWDVVGGNGEAYFAASNDHGATFGPAQNLSDNGGHSFFPRVAAVEHVGGVNQTD